MSGAAAKVVVADAVAGAVRVSAAAPGDDGALVAVFDPVLFGGAALVREALGDAGGGALVPGAG